MNKHSASYNKSNNVEDDSASKWTYLKWMEYLKEKTSCDIDILEGRIRDICVKSCISIEPLVYNSVAGLGAQKHCCFELFGFDILVDK